MERFGSSGARGPVETELRPATVLEIARAAVGHWTAERVAIGRDVRVTGPALVAAATSGAMSAGADVDDLGMTPTPSVQSYADAHEIPAIVITASHNPPADNGVKLIAPDGGELSVPDYEAVEGRLDDETPEQVAWDAFGTVERIAGANDRYVDDLVEALDRGTIADADLRVVVDAGTGAAGATSPSLCRRLGCEVISLNAQPDGTFPARTSEPVPEALDTLAETVDHVGADLGVAHDGDGDRAVFVDERGEIVDGGAVLAALATSVTDPGDAIVSAISAPSALADVAEENDADLELTPVGAVNVLTRVRQLQDSGQTVSIAGEQNGGIILPEFSLARDGGYTLGRMLELVAEAPLSELTAPYAAQVFRRRDLHVADENSMEGARGWASAQSGRLTDIDGIRVDFDDSWVLVRESGTEPLVRIYAEAPSEARAAALIDEVAAAIGSG